LAELSGVLAELALDGRRGVRHDQGMKRFVIWYLPQAALFALLVPAWAQTPLEVNKTLYDRWKACVELRFALGPERTTPFGGVETAFQGCQTEEQLFLAALAFSVVSQQNKDRVLVEHFQRKLELKNHLEAESFRELAKQLGPKP
jgi:hypothetical protein